MARTGIFHACLFGSIFLYNLKTWQSQMTFPFDYWWNFTQILSMSYAYAHSFDIGKNWTNVEKNVSNMWQTRVMCLGLWPMDSLWNSDLFTCKPLSCSSIWSKVSKNCTKMKKTCRTRVGHVTDMCHVSGTMTIGFLAKFWPVYM